MFNEKQKVEPTSENGNSTKLPVISSAAKKHRWSRPLKKFCDTGSYCLDCGLKRERHGLLGTWYSNSKTDVHGWDKQPCIVPQ